MQHFHQINVHSWPVSTSHITGKKKMVYPSCTGITGLSWWLPTGGVNKQLESTSYRTGTTGKNYLCSKELKTGVSSHILAPHKVMEYMSITTGHVLAPHKVMEYTSITFNPIQGKTHPCTATHLLQTEDQ